MHTHSELTQYIKNINKSIRGLQLLKKNALRQLEDSSESTGADEAN